VSAAFLSPEERERAIRLVAAHAEAAAAEKMAEVIDRHSFADGDHICITVNVETTLVVRDGRVELPAARVVRG
jgi:hypothetical protein